MQAPQTTSQHCYHCGLNCDTPNIAVGDRQFCCVGCRAVYLLLSNNSLTEYYQQSDKPSDRNRPAELASEKYAYLDNPEIARGLKQFSGGTTTQLTFTLPQIHCASCIWLLEKLPQLNPAIHRTEVNFPTKELLIRFNETALSLRSLVELLNSLGYEPILRLDNASKTDADSRISVNQKTTYLKLGVAGFAFGNIMLLSFPEYLSGSTVVEPQIARILGLASLALSLPALFYAGFDFLKSAYTGLRNRALNIDVPIALGMLALFGLSAYEILSSSGAGYLDSFSGLIFFLLVGRLFQEKTYSALSFERDYRSFFPISSLRKTNGKTESAPLDSLRVGDRLVIRNGELIPADGVLMRGEAEIDYSFVTGESENQLCTEGTQVYAGGRQCSGAIEVELTHEVAQSYLTRLWSSGDVSKADSRTMTSLADRVATYFTPAVLLIATGAFLYWLHAGVAVALHTATATLIVACPCALALTSPFAYGAALRLLARLNIFVKNASVLEHMSQVTHIIFDKTGTLTTGASAKFRSLVQTTSSAPTALTPYQQALTRSLTQQSTHPASRAVAGSLSGAVTFDIADFTEKTGSGISAVIDGHEVHLGSLRYAKEVTQQGGNSHTPPIGAPNLHGDLYLVIDTQIIGVFALPASLRPSIHETTRNLRQDYTLALLSGDTDRQSSLMQTVFTSNEDMVFSASPAEKMSYIKRLQEMGKKTLMLGDGLNDAGAFAAADVGVALSDEQGGFSPASDVIINAAGFSHIANTLQFSKRIRRVIIAGFVLSLAYNLVGITIAVTGALTPVAAAILMPISSITVVTFATLMTYIAGKRSKMVI